MFTGDLGTRRAALYKAAVRSLGRGEDLDTVGAALAAAANCYTLLLLLLLLWLLLSVLLKLAQGSPGVG